ncbi:MAG: sensor histidine kinase, partial [Bacteroidales bacterium]|nr:sensor histidine kinase [Bacteroidales bacterium]
AIRLSKENTTIEISGETTFEYFIIHIDDTGMGFSQLALKQLDKSIMVTEAQMDYNSGLSLRLAKLIMKLHKGEIRIERIDDITRVSVCFPICETNV